jgi:hypothetical protein
MVLKIENPHFTITLYGNFLKIDLKGSLKNEIEEALENKPVLKETLGHILGIFIPLHISVSEITSVSMEETRKIKISIRHHRDVVLPLERKEDAEKLLEKLNQAVLYARTAKIKKRLTTRRAKKRPKKKSGGSSPSSYGTVPYFFPTEQTDIVDKLNRKKIKRKRGKPR